MKAIYTKLLQQLQGMQTTISQKAYD